MNLKPLALNMTELRIKDKTILFSYQTPVAMIDHSKFEDSFYKTSKYWSRTTSRHINKWFQVRGGIVPREMSQEFFDNLLK